MTVERIEEIERQRAIVRRSNQIPRDLMNEAVEHFRREFPDADRFRAGLYGDRVYVEIWRKGRAKVIFY